MLNVSVIGIGNAGSQVAALAKEKLNVDAVAINSSERDLETIPQNTPTRMIGDGRGAGKERKASLNYLKDSIMTIINDEELKSIFKKDVLFVVSSTGGGTGSGASIVLANVLRDVYKDAVVILVGILPTLREGLSTQTNTVAYLTDLYDKMDKATYMLYDNDKLSKLSTPLMMQKINESIVDDIDIIRGTYQLPTRFSSIDENDMLNIINTKGRIAIAGLKDIKEKDLDEHTIDDMLVNEFKTNAHCELQLDKIVHRTGVIVALSERIMDVFDSHLPKVQELVGVPVEEFEHIAFNEDRHLPNNVFVIASGLTQVNDRIRKTNDRIEELLLAQEQREEDSELHAVDLNSVTSKIERKTASTGQTDVDISSIFDKYN